jgi:hypothetical protein
MSTEEKLTPQQDRAIELLLSGNSIIRICEELSINRLTLYRWRKNKRFSDAYSEARRALSERTREMLQRAATRAVRRLVELMEDDTESEVPSSVQYAAARSILELNFKGTEFEELQTSVEELRQLLGEPKKGLRAA